MWQEKDEGKAGWHKINFIAFYGPFKTYILLRNKLKPLHFQCIQGNYLTYFQLHQKLGILYEIQPEKYVIFEADINSQSQRLIFAINT